MTSELIIGGLLVLTVVVIVVTKKQIQQDAQNAADSGDSVAEWGVFDSEPTQETTLFEDAIVTATPSTYSAANVDADTAESNIKAFLDMIAFAEGTAGPRGYQTLFGGGTFNSFADHPRQYFSFTDKTGKVNKTSAAGRYQFLIRTWDDLRGKLGLSDFGPNSQDSAAIELIRQRGALNDVKAGRIEAAITKCAPIWASLPGAGYNQPERKLSSLITAFNNNGGTLA